MKKILLPILIFISLQAYSQSYFDKKTHFIEASLGGGNYKSSINNTVNKTGNGGQTILGLDYEYGLSKRFGIGGVIELGGLENKNLKTNFSSGVLGIKGYYHFYCAEKSTMFAALTIAGTSASSLLASGETINGGGNNLQLALGIRKQLFVKWLGFHANISLTRYNLDKWKDSKEFILKNDTGDDNLAIKLSGINFTTGVSFRF